MTKTRWYMGIALFLACSVVMADSVHKISAEAVKESAIVSSGEPKLRFEFEGEEKSTAWLKSSGQWHAEAWIKHAHFRCGHYQLGIQFGKGEPACLNVKWYGEPVFISRKRQCNNTTIHHQDGAQSAELVQKFSQVTCAQQVIKCTGVCD